MLVGLLVSPAPAQAAFPWRAVITFDKNWSNPASSRVVWKLSNRQRNGAWKVVETRTWRAGSGMLGRAGRNSCVKNTGWLPNGDYAVRQWNDYPGHVIKGRAFQLDNKRCSNGTLRQSLFLHTEQGPGSRQCRDRRGDQACRWEFPRINDYKSYGCIKLAPRDLAALVGLYHRHFDAGVRYPTNAVVLRVTS